MWTTPEPAKSMNPTSASGFTVLKADSQPLGDQAQCTTTG